MHHPGRCLDLNAEVRACREFIVVDTGKPCSRTVFEAQIPKVYSESWNHSNPVIRRIEPWQSGGKSLRPDTPCLVEITASEIDGTDAGPGVNAHGRARVFRVGDDVI